MNTFTNQELDLLIEALGTWEAIKTRGPHPLAAVIGGIFQQCDDPECDACRQSRAQAAAEERKRCEESKLASERSILLRAKLIGLRDSAAADKVFDEAANTKTI